MRNMGPAAHSRRVLFRTDESFHLDDLFCLKFFCVCVSSDVPGQVNLQWIFRRRIETRTRISSRQGNVLRARGPGSGIALTQQEHIRCVVARRLLFDPAIWTSMHLWITMIFGSVLRDDRPLVADSGSTSSIEFFSLASVL